MKDSVFRKFRALVYERSGISLSNNKQALVQARIARRMRRLNISNCEEYFRAVMDDGSGIEIQEMLDSISTNVTGFYREPAHFDFLREIVAEWAGQGMKSLRFWSTACSTGEEPYTMAIEIKEAIGSHGVDARILATDISSRVLELAVTGEYSRKKVEPVPNVLKVKYFTRTGGRENPVYQMKSDLKEMITFRQFNLASPSFPIHRPLDMIFCRNVMIYFDRETRIRLVQQFHRSLRAGGYLLVGHAESITVISSGFRCVRPSIYIKR